MKKHRYGIKGFTAAAALALVLMLFSSPVTMVAFAQEEQAAQTGLNAAAGTLNSAVLENYETVARTEKVALHADMTDGSFIFEDKQSGKLWYSTPPDAAKDKKTKGIRRNQMRSQIVVDFIDMRTATVSAVPTSANSYGDSVRNGTVSVAKIDNGIRVEFTFEEEGFVVPVEFTLKGDSLSATIKSAEIQQKSFNYIQAIHLLPTFLAAGADAEGYLFVPDGSGAIVSFNNGKGSYASYEKPVYGADETLEEKERSTVDRTVIMPVFGIKNGGDALTAVITQGDAISSICANVSGEGMGYNRVFSKMVLGVVDTTTLFEADYFNVRKVYRVEQRKQIKDYEIRYFSNSSQQADYAGMAAVYRSYLTENGLLGKNPAAPSLWVDFYGAVTKQASFLGIPYQKLTPLTTFDQARKMVEELQKNGAQSLTVRYSGWLNRGLKNAKIPTKAKPLGVLGGKKDYLSFAESLEIGGSKLYSAVDFVNIEKSGNSFSALSDVAKTLFNTRAKQYSYLRSVYVSDLKVDPWYLLKPQRLNTAAKKFIRSFEKLKTPGGVLLDEIGGMVYSDFDKSGSDRAQTVDYYREMMKAFGDTALAVDGGNAYTYAYAEHVYALPMNAGGALMFDESVPFVQLVLHGYLPYSSEDMNRETDLNRAFLKCIETGSDPYFAGMYADADGLIETSFNSLYSSSFSRWKQTAAEMAARYREVYQDLYNQAMTGHTKLAENLYRTTFENGVKILVNYSGAPQTADGVVVEANNFTVVGG